MEPDKNNKKETKKMGWTHAERRLTPQNGHRRKNEGKAGKRKTKTDDVGLDDDGWIWKAQGGGTATRGVATSDI